MSDLIDRQAAIDALCEEPEVWSGNDEYAQGLNNQWHYDVNALRAVPSAQRWIPVTERLPQESGWYLAYMFAQGIQWGDITTKDSAWIQLVFFYDGKFEKLTGSGVLVTHWMPLPEPPKEET